MIDLHAHTTISDGTLTPTQLVRLAKEMGLSALAITDHDSIEGLEEAKKEAENIGIRLIEGIEFDVRYKDNQIEYRMHLLGLDIDSNNEEFLEIYTKYRKGKEEKVDDAIKELVKLGINLTRNDLVSYQQGAYLDRQCMAKYLLDKKYVSMLKYGWINYIDKIPFTEEELMPIEDAIKAIHIAGGKAFLAHYHLNIGLNRFSEDEKVKVLERMRGMGLDGMEYCYPSFTKEDQEQCGAYIKKFNFLRCGGSDFHGLNRPNIQLAIGEGDFAVADDLVKEWLEI